MTKTNKKLKYVMDHKHRMVELMKTSHTLSTTTNLHDLSKETGSTGHGNSRKIISWGGGKFKHNHTEPCTVYWECKL